MPDKPLRPCNKIGCNSLTRERYCELHSNIAIVKRESSSKRGYGKKWQKESKKHLALHPFCVECGELATDVDHIIPHKGNMNLFWDKRNWQSMCGRCHSKKTAKEDGGFGNKSR
ncbi:MAG: endonuclease [Oscillospiraceae bacterium]|nr:endonuclease [Oscillospiraceae bacterium]